MPLTRCAIRLCVILLLSASVFLWAHQRPHRMSVNGVVIQGLDLCKVLTRCRPDGQPFVLLPSDLHQDGDPTCVLPPQTHIGYDGAFRAGVHHPPQGTPVLLPVVSCQDTDDGQHLVWFENASKPVLGLEYRPPSGRQ